MDVPFNNITLLKVTFNNGMSEKLSVITLPAGLLTKMNGSVLNLGILFTTIEQSRSNTRLSTVEVFIDDCRPLSTIHWHCRAGN